MMIRLGHLYAVLLAFALGIAGNAAAQEPMPTDDRATASAYRINAGDELEIYVWGEERLQRSAKVLPDGTIAFPLVGQLVAQGQRPQDLERAITAGLQGQYRGQVPQVTVSVLSPAGLQFSVLGRVRSPGSFAPGRYVNVLEALSLAGGPTEFANLDNIIILRKTGGQLQTLRVAVGSLFKGGSPDRVNLTRLDTGDTIIVP